jgi:hypothetical protein
LQVRCRLETGRGDPSTTLRIAPLETGRGDWIRTSDPLRPRQVRYQAALRPDLRQAARACRIPIITQARRVMQD